MNKITIGFILKILIAFLIVVSFILLASAQTPDVSIERTINYNVNLDDSADVTIFNGFENINETDLHLYVALFAITEVSEDLANIKIYSPNTNMSFTEHNFSSIEEGIKNIKPYEYSHFVSWNGNYWDHLFIVGLNINLIPKHAIQIYTSYSIENFVLPNTGENITVIQILSQGLATNRIIGNNSIDIINRNFNIVVNLPRDRYYYSQLMYCPVPSPDETMMIENTPSLSWYFPPTINRTRTIIIAYKIKEDSLKKTLDNSLISVEKQGEIATLLGFLSFIIAVIGVIGLIITLDIKPKLKRNVILIIIIMMVIIIGILF